MNIPAGTIHDATPKDLSRMLRDNPKALATWLDITPLARNEWICWVENAKLNETRIRRIGRSQEDLSAGKRRPCCWIGCVHRTDKEISPSVQGILARNKSSK